MKNSKFRFFMDWGLTALAVIASSVLLCFALLKFSVIATVVGKIVTVLMPIIYGGVLAYLMLPVYNASERYVQHLFGKIIKNNDSRGRLAKSIATLVSLAVLFAIVVGLFSMLIPQIYESIIGFQDSLTEYINNLTLWIGKLLQDNEHLRESIMPYYNEAVMRFQNWIATDLVPNISLIFDRVSSGVISFVTVLKRGSFCPQNIWRLYYRQTLRFTDHWYHVFLFSEIFKNALCTFDQRDCRCYQCDPILWTIYWGSSKCIFDPSGGSYEVPVFSDLHSGTPTV